MFSVTDYYSYVLLIIDQWSTQMGINKLDYNSCFLIMGKGISISLLLTRKFIIFNLNKDSGALYREKKKVLLDQEENYI